MIFNEEGINKKEKDNKDIKENEKEEKEVEEEEEDMQEEREEEEEEGEKLDTMNNKINENKNFKKKCSLKDHEESDAIFYCIECKIYMCNKCEKIHGELFKNHNLYNLDKDIKDIFTGFCKEEKHQSFELEYFCKNHNQLCCAACISKLKGKKNGKHNDCDIYFIEKIKDIKKNNLIFYINFLINIYHKSLSLFGPLPIL